MNTDYSWNDGNHFEDYTDEELLEWWEITEWTEEDDWMFHEAKQEMMERNLDWN
jgi:hypothetical protein